MKNGNFLFVREEYNEDCCNDVFFYGFSINSCAVIFRINPADDVDSSCTVDVYRNGTVVCHNTILDEQGKRGLKIGINHR